MTALIILVIAYLLGSIPFGVLITRFAGVGDVRNIGSGNIGATNVLRTGRKDLAFATLLLDGGKGAVAVGIAAFAIGPDATISREFAMAIAAAGAFLGHCFPIFLKFKGGKGVATFIGTTLALNWKVGLVACGLWLAVAIVTRYSSLSALVMALITPFLYLVFGQFAFFLGAAAMTGILFYRHSTNISRLRAGEEPKIGAKKTEAQPHTA